MLKFLICQFLFMQTGWATWYNTGITTATGESFNITKYTCAMTSRSYFHKMFKVTNTKTKKTVVVRCNDLLPQNSNGVIVDLTPAAFEAIGKLSEGKIRVKVEELKNVPIKL